MALHFEPRRPVAIRSLGIQPFLFIWSNQCVSEYERERERGERDEEGGGVTKLTQQLACIVTDLQYSITTV